jgi:trimeric autotransporter adhesin
MKHIISIILALSLTHQLQAAALDIRISQRNPNNNAWSDVIFAKQNSALLGTTTLGRPSIVTIGSGLDLTSGILTATGSGGAPTTATYITQTPNGSLSAEQALSLLSSGIMRAATTTGIITSLGDPTSVGSAFMFTANPSAITFARVNADNTVTYQSSTDYRTSLGLGTLATQSGTFSGTSSGTNTGDQNLFGSIIVAGQTTVTASANPTALTLVAGANITLTTDNTTKNVTITASGSGSGNITGPTMTANAVVVGAGTTTIAPLASLGTSGQALVSAGAGAPPAFGTLGVAGGGTGLTVGTSGGILGYTATGTLASSAALASGNIVVGGGAGATPVTRPVQVDASGNTIFGAAGVANITANVATITTATITTLNATDINISNPVGVAAGGTGLSAGTSGGVPYFSGTTTIASSAALVSGNIILGGGTGAAPFTSNISVSGNNTTLPGNLTAGGAVILTATLSTDDTFRGTALSGLNAGATIAQWEVVYLDGSSTWQLADADGSGTYPARGVAVAGYSSTDPAVILREGTARNDAWSWTPGGTLYISATPGGLTQTPPSTSTHKVQQVGFALTADIAYFNFASGEYLTVE